MYKQFINPIIRGLFLLIIIVLLFFAMRLSIGYLYPFLIAFIIAASLNPYVSYIEKKWYVSRTIATCIIIISIFLLFAGIVFLLINEIIRGTAYLMDKLPQYFQAFIQFLEKIINDFVIPIYQSITSYFQSLNPSHQATIEANLKTFLEDLAVTGTDWLQSAIIQIPDVVGFFPSFFAIFIFIVLATFLMLNDWHNLTTLLKEWIPDKLQSFLEDIYKGIKKAFSGYLRAQFILVFISAVIIFIGLSILRIEHALTIAAIVALVDLLPVIGTGIMFIPWILYSFFMGDYKIAIGLTIVYMIVIVVRQLIEPKILSSSIGINPLLSLVILYITIQIWGVTGVLFAPIILILVYVIIQSNIITKMIQFVKGS